jgi:hypothetical protein
LQDISALTAEPAFGVSTSGLSGEASQLGLRAPAGTLPPNQVRIILRFGLIRSMFPQGRHRAFRSAIVCLAPRVLPLTPQVAFRSHADDPLFGTSRTFRILLCIRGHHRAFHPGAFLSDHSIRDGPFPFSPPGCDTGRFQRQFSVRSEPLDGGPPHWLTVATIGFHRLCSPHAPKPRNGGRNSDLRPVFRPAPLVVRVTDRCRSPPGFLVV